MICENRQQRRAMDIVVSDQDVLTELDDVHALIDWDLIEGMLFCIHNNNKVEQAWPLLMMFKALLLQSWYDLSDLQLGQQLARDLLFRRFVGLRFTELVPDQRRLWRFRHNPKVQQLFGVVLAEIREQLTTRSLYLKRGEISIVDASLIEVRRN
jgi:transposase, IS5 family